MAHKSSSVTIRDVARRTGVSVLTVSRNINQNTPLLQEMAELDPQITPDLHHHSPVPAFHPLFPLINGEPAEQVSLLRIHTILPRSPDSLRPRYLRKWQDLRARIRWPGWWYFPRGDRC